MEKPKNKFSGIETLENIFGEKSSPITVGLSGGSSIKPVLNWLRLNSSVKENINLVVIDERQVPYNHPESNRGMVEKMLGPGVAALSAREIWENNICIKNLDVLIMGFGADGHIASVFPGLYSQHVISRSIAYRTKHAWGVPNIVRFSLDEIFLLSASKIYLLIQGAEKMVAFEKIMKEGDTRIPLVRLLKKRPDTSKLCI